MNVNITSFGEDILIQLILLLILLLLLLLLLMFLLLALILTDVFHSLIDSKSSDVTN